MMRCTSTCLSLCLVSLCSLPVAAQTPAVSPEQTEFFEKHIRPVLAEQCYSCHGDKRQRGDVRLDSRQFMLQGNEQGPVLVPGQPDRSRLVKVLHYQGEIKMPPKGKLPDHVIADFTTWIKMGAPWPGSDKVAVRTGTDGKPKHWAFEPVQKPPLPDVQQTAWVQSPADRFVLAQLEAKGMKPAPAADRRTLIRRAYFDLIGLPPGAEEVEAFAADTSPDAFAKVVDRLLDSPRYGERWGRYWLDVARYADTKGYVFQEERRYPYSYTYRDYVIRAFNEDLPYDRFILEQLAADQLVAADAKYDKRALAAMGFLTLGRRFLNNTHDIIDDRIDVVTRGLQGLTVACARCHDHKYDPIPSKDYYSLYGVFASCEEPKDLPLIGEPEPTPEYQAFQKEVAKRQQAVEKYQQDHKDELAKNTRKNRDELRALQKKVDAFRASSVHAPPRAMVLTDRPQPHNPHVFLRGKPGNVGEAVPRQFLAVLAGPDRKPFTRGSGRLELARAIASRDNPLTARVLVNRVWLHHFGQGLVTTPSDFGTRCEPPSHPQLLDFLAGSLMDNGWSIKNLHRLIMLSSTYQQAGTDNPAYRERDPENRLLWRMNRQRLDFEALRDSLLAVSGSLDLRMGGRSVDITTAPFTNRRTVYAFIDRQNLPGLFRTFDFASPDSSTPKRFTTTVPQQALFLLNHTFVIEQAKKLLQLPELSGELSAEQKIRQLYRRVYGRQPDPEEITLGLAFVNGSSNNPQLNPWQQYAQVLLLSNEFAFVD